MSEDDAIRAHGGDPEFMRRLERGEHLTDGFLKGIGDDRPDVDPEVLKSWQAQAKAAADDLRLAIDGEACQSAPRTAEELAEQVAEQDAWLASQAESVLFAAPPEPELKMYAIFSPAALKAMKGIRGKLAAQAGHAYLHAWWDAVDRHPFKAWTYRKSPRAYKIALVAPDDVPEDWYDELLLGYRDVTGVTKVVDAGLTVFDGPTLTCIGIGPINPDAREAILRSLRPLS